MQFSKGMRDRLDKYLDENKKIELSIEISGQAVYDCCCFGLNQGSQLFDERYMIFYNNICSPENEVVYIKESNKIKFWIELKKIPSCIQKLVFSVSIDGDGVMSEIDYQKVLISQEGVEKIVFHITGSDFSTEKAVILIEIYRKGVWRIGAVANGFNGGLNTLLTHFGGTDKIELEKKEVVQERYISHLINSDIENIAVSEIDIKKWFWETINEFNEIDTEEKIWKDIVMGELRKDSYSMSQLENIYKNGIPEKGLECFYGEDFGMVILGYSLLSRYGLSPAEYIQWCDKIEGKYRYLLYKLIGKEDSRLEGIYYTDRLIPIMNFFKENEKKLFTLSDEENGIFLLDGYTLKFSKDMEAIFQYYRFCDGLKTDTEIMFKEQYSRMIFEFDDCADYLMNIVKDVNEVAIKKLKAYIENMDYSTRKVEGAIEIYFDKIKQNTPYNFFLKTYADIAEKYAEDAIKNEIRRIQRENVEFVGGGFGIKGLISGSIQATVANEVYKRFIPHISAHADKRIIEKMNATKKHIFSKPTFLNKMTCIMVDNIDALCNVILLAIPLGQMISWDYDEYESKIGELYEIESYLSAEDLQEVSTLILQTYPFKKDSYEFTYDVFGDEDNDLEILAMAFGIDEFYDYKAEEEPDGLSKEIHCQIKENARFGFDEIKRNQQRLFPVLKHIKKIDDYLDTKALEYERIDSLMRQLFDIMEANEFCKGNEWLSNSAVVFLLKKRIHPLLKRISEIICLKDHKMNYFDYNLISQCSEDWINEKRPEYTKDEILTCLEFIEEKTIQNSNDWISVIKYRDWLSNEGISVLKKLKTELEKELKKILDEEKKKEQEEEKCRKAVERKDNFVKYMKLYLKENSENTDFDKSYRFRNSFKSQMERSPYSECVFRYDFEVEKEKVRQYIETVECGFGAQYILWCNTRSKIVLTDHNLYVSGQKVSLWKIIWIFKMRPCASVSGNNWIVIEMSDGSKVIHNIGGVEDSIFVDDFNIAMNTIGQGIPPSDTDEIYYCKKCKSRNVKKKLIGYKCDDCGNNDAKMIGYCYSNPQHLRRKQQYIYTVETNFLQWCKDCFPEMRV